MLGSVPGGKESALLPMHLPRRPDRLNLGVHPLRSRRRAQRQRRWRMAWEWMEWQVALYSLLELGSPKDEQRLQRALGSWCIMPRQQIAAEMLVAELLPFCRLQPDLLSAEDAALRE